MTPQDADPRAGTGAERRPAAGTPLPEPLHGPLTRPAHPLPPPPRASRAGEPPARPPVGGTSFAASLDVGPPPSALVASVTLWVVGAVLALLAGTLLWRDRAQVRAALRDSVVARDPDVAADVVAQAAGWAFAAATGSLALLGVVLALLARPLRHGRPWARPALLAAGSVGVVVALAVQDLVRSDGALLDAPVRLALLTMVAVLGAAAVTVGLPRCGAWLGRARARPRPR